MAGSVGNLTGIDVGSIVDQLMAVESRQRTMLQGRITANARVSAAYQGLLSATTALRTTAAAIANPSVLSSTWPPYVTSSSSPSVTVSLAGSRSTQSATFDVVALAMPHRVLHSRATALATQVCDQDHITVTVGAARHDVALTDGSLDGVVQAINSTAGIGVRAAAVRVGEGAYRLQLTSLSTGMASRFTVDGLNAEVGDAVVTTSGQDARILIGPDPVLDAVSSSTNTFPDVFPGLAFTVSEPGAGFTIGSAQDGSAAAAQARRLIDGINLVTGTIATHTASGSAGARGALLGATGPARLREALAAALTTTDGTSLASVGIEADRSGVVTLDASRFEAAFATDRAGTMARIEGLARRVHAAAASSSDPESGALTLGLSGVTTTTERISASIADWDRRLELRRTALERQFVSMQTSLSRLQSQSTWLTGQIKQLGARDS